MNRRLWSGRGKYSSILFAAERRVRKRILQRHIVATERRVRYSTLRRHIVAAATLQGRTTGASPTCSMLSSSPPNPPVSIMPVSIKLPPPPPRLNKPLKSGAPLYHRHTRALRRQGRTTGAASAVEELATCNNELPPGRSNVPARCLRRRVGENVIDLLDVGVVKRRAWLLHRGNRQPTRWERRVTASQ